MMLLKKNISGGNDFTITGYRVHAQGDRVLAEIVPENQIEEFLTDALASKINTTELLAAFRERDCQKVRFLAKQNLESVFNSRERGRLHLFLAENVLLEINNASQYATFSQLKEFVTSLEAAMHQFSIREVDDLEVGMMQKVLDIFARMILSGFKIDRKMFSMAHSVQMWDLCKTNKVLFPSLSFEYLQRAILRAEEQES